MNQPVAILASPAPLDGYPPVQNQAILLADAGYRVEIVTSSLPHRNGNVDFSYPNVFIHARRSRRNGKFNALIRSVENIVPLTLLRWKHRKAQLVEIAYDPLGALYSDYALFRPAFRILHFHELLARMDGPSHEARLLDAVKSYDYVVVPDESRATDNELKLGQSISHFVVPNFPLRLTRSDERQTFMEGDSRKFEVIYCGSIGRSQMIDVIIESCPQWNDGISFTIIGRDDSVFVKQLKSKVATLHLEQVVTFLGWMELQEAERRLPQADIGISFLNEHHQWNTALTASNKRYQYMQAGLPQIGDTKPGVEELLSGNGIGINVKPITPDNIALAVNTYFADPDRVEREGSRARKFFEEQFNYALVFAPLLEVINKRLEVGGE